MQILSANSSNPPDGYHGETLNCSSCHSGSSVNSGDGGINLSGLPSNYTPGQTYDLSITVSGTQTNGYGFQLIPKANGSVSGNLSSASADLGIQSNALEHRGTSSSGIWNFQWTAPSADEGTVTFYASGIATGGSSGNGGDQVYTLSQNLSANSFTNASMEWNASTGGVIFSSPAVGQDGSVYIGSNDNKLHAYNSDGTAKWTFTAGNWIDSTPAISANGIIYVGSWDNKLYALYESNGSKLWEYETNSYVIASPAIGADGRIYVGSKDSILYAFENNGSVAWEYFAGQPVTSSAALGQDGTIYFGDENGTFHAVNPDGTTKWTYEVDTVSDTNKSILSSAALDLAGNIYFGSGNGYCYSLSDNDSNASLNWKFLTGDRVDASPVIGINDEIFFVSRDGYMRSLSSLSGGLNWDAFVGDVFYSSPVVDQNGRTYVIGYTGGGENHLFAYDANGSLAWDTNDTNCPFGIGGIVDSSLALSEDGKIYYGCYDNHIYCLDVNQSPATSDWPMFQRNSRRDGAWPSYLLETSVSPLGSGSISGGGIYNQGAVASVSAASTTQGYTFVSWTGADTGTSNPLSLTVNSNLSLTANFSLNSYILTIDAGVGGIVSGSGTYDHGTQASITATPTTGYLFSGWSGVGITDSTSQNTTILMTQSSTVTANFTPQTFSVSTGTSPSGIGQVTGSGNYQYGQIVDILASATTPGYSFNYWSGDSSGSVNPLSLIIDSNLSLTANFGLAEHSLILNAGVGGSVTGSGTFNYGSLSSIQANPSEGYTFTEWIGNGVADSSASSTTVEMIADRNVSAIFSQNRYQLTLYAGEGGTVSEDGNFTHGEHANITAIPNEGFSFVKWNGDGITSSFSPSTTVEMNQNQSVSALFSINYYHLYANSSVGGSVNGEGNYSHGQEVVISAVPETGYSFLNWTGDIAGNSTSPSLSILMDSNKSITANFALTTENHYVLSILSNPTNAGTTTQDASSYPLNTTANISANPATGYEFLSWNGGGIIDVNSSSTTLNIASDLTITANFQIKSYTLEMNSSTGGTTSTGGNFEYSTDVNITAFPENGYSFTNWIGDGILDPLSSSTSVSMTQNRTVVPNFTILKRTLTLAFSEGGAVHGGGVYNHGSSVQINATPSSGYTFEKWNGTYAPLDPYSSITSIQLSQDTNLTAQFSRSIYSLQIETLGGGTVSSGGNYYYGYNASISANPANGYQFEKWEGTGIADINSRYTTVQMTADRNVSALFSILSLSDSLNDSVKIAENWYTSTWFGTFFHNQGGWTYHLTFGWIYPIIENQNSIWFWNEQLGWVWVAQETFTDFYIWSENSKNWIYWDDSNHSSIRFYDYSNLSWVNFDI
jgi:uncharacterized repeat protein (TIGR02543 family)